MNTQKLWIVVILILVLALTGYAFSMNKAIAPSNETVTPSSSEARLPVLVEPSATENAAPVTTVTLTDAGFSPAIVTVSLGETVRFVNASSRGMWVGSDDHPTHTEYDGTSTREHCADGAATNGTFDQCTASPTQSRYEYTFRKTGIFGYHNHVGASSVGTVIVK